MHSSSELSSARVLLMGLWVKLKAQRADNLGARLPKHTLEWPKRAYDFLEVRIGLEQEPNKEGAEQNFCSSTLRFVLRLRVSVRWNWPRQPGLSKKSHGCPIGGALVFFYAEGQASSGGVRTAPHD